MKTAAGAEQADTPLPWYAKDDFQKIVRAEITKAIHEAEVMESLAIEQAESRLKRVRPPDQSVLLVPVFAQLRAAIPPEHTRYNTSEAFPSLKNVTNPIRIGCPPMAMSSLLLLRSLASNLNVPVEIFSHHQSSSAILSTVEQNSLDFVILSWGAAEKMLQREEIREAEALMLLPRTSIDLLAPGGNEHREEDRVPVYVSKDEAGYPYQYFEAIKNSGVEPWGRAEAFDANIVEIIARLTKSPSCGIVSFPFSGVLALHFGYKVQDLSAVLPVRFSDNILFRVGGGESSRAASAELCSALRSGWYRLLEDAQFLEESIRGLLADTQYIQSLKRLGGLYRIAK